MIKYTINVYDIIYNTKSTNIFTINKKNAKQFYI